jgi:methionyl-tRNA formyltransferase
MERVTQAYLEVLAVQLSGLLDGSAPLVAQDASRATYTCKRVPADNQIDWTASTDVIFNLIRATSAPYPGASTTHGGQELRVWAAKRLPAPKHYVGRIPGRIVEVIKGLGTVVLTGDGALMLTEVQQGGGAIVEASELLRNVTDTLGR